MALVENKGKDPKGQMLPIPIDGAAYTWDTPLAANEEKTTGWIAIEMYKSLHYIIQSDQPGVIAALEYSTDGTNVSAGGTSRAYVGGNLLLQTFVALKDKYFRIRYQNGATPQTKFFFEARLSISVGQNTMNSVFLPITQTNVASITKSVIELKDGTGTYDQVQRTADALNVHIANQPEQITSVEVSNLPATQAVTGEFYPVTQPISGTVAVSNFPNTVEISNDSGNPLPIGGTVSVSNLPVTQPVSGSVSISNLPATQPVSGAVSISNLPSTQPVSAVSLPLPSGAATLAKQDTGNASLTSIDAKVALASKQDAANTLLQSIADKANSYTNTVVGGDTAQDVYVSGGQLNVAVVSNETRDYIWQQTQAGNVYMFSTGVIAGLIAITNIRAYLSNPVGSGKTLYIFSLVLDNASAAGGIYANIIANPTTNLPTTAKTPINMNMGSANTTAVLCYADTGSAMSGGSALPSALAAAGQRTEFLEDQQIIIVPAGSKIGVNLPIPLGISISYQIIVYGVWL